MSASEQNNVELSKWKSRCASLTAEVVCLRSIVTLLNPDLHTEHNKLIFYYLTHANRIKSDRELGIDNPVSIKIDWGDGEMEELVKID